jgi:hypothetical protein
VDKHVLNKVVGRLPKAVAPYLVKYVLPPLAVLYVLTGVSAYYSVKTAKKMNANPRKRRRRR